MKARKTIRLVLAVMVIGLPAGSAVAQTGWMQPGVRVWYLGGVDGGGVISSNAIEAYLLESISGTTGTVVRHAAVTNWTVPQPVETGAYPLLDMGPHWIHPQRLQTLAQGDYWKGQRITLVQPETHTIDTFVAHLPYPLLVARALFDQHPQRLIYKVTYQLSLLSTGNAYVDAQTGLLLYHQAMWGVTKMFFLLAEINYDFANGLAYQEDGGPHTGFRSVTSEQSQGVYTGGIFVGGGSVVFQSLVESRYGPMLQTFVQSSVVPSSWGIKTENYAFIGTGSIVRHIDWALAPSVPIEQWNPFGEHLWWWLPPSLTGAQGGAPAPGINVFDVPMAKTSDQPLTYTAAQNPSRFHCSRLTFDSHGYLTVFSARDPSTGLYVQPGDFSFQNGTTVTGLSYFQQQMALPEVGTPAISSVFPVAGPTSGGDRRHDWWGELRGRRHRHHLRRRPGDQRGGAEPDVADLHDASQYAWRARRHRDDHWRQRNGGGSLHLSAGCGRDSACHAHRAGHGLPACAARDGHRHVPRCHLSRHVDRRRHHGADAADPADRLPSRDGLLPERDRCDVHQCDGLRPLRPRGRLERRHRGRVLDAVAAAGRIDVVDGHDLVA